MPIRYEVQRVRVNPDSTTVIVTGSTLSGLENVGGGAEVYKGLDGSTAQLRTFTEGAGITITQSGDTINIENSSAGDFVSNDTFTGYTATTETRLQGIESDVSDNSDNILTLSGDVAQNTSDIAALSGDVGTISGDTEQLRIDVDAVSAQTDINTSNISSNTFAIAQNASDIAINAGNISGNTADIAQNTSDIAQNTSDIQLVSGETVTNATNISINTSNISSNASDISQNASDISQNTSDISTLNGITSGNTADIAQNTSDIATLSGDTAQLRIDVDAVSGDTITNANDISNLQTDKVNVSGDTMTGVLEVPQLNLDTGYTATGHQTGSMHWNPTDGTIDLHLLKDVTLQAGQESMVYGEAIETLTDGDLVQSYGFKTDGTIRIGKTDPVLFGADYYTGNDVAVMTSSAVSGETCYATVFGRVRGVNLSYSAGTTMFMSNTVRGLLTGVEPVYPETRIPVGFVAVSGASGELIVNPALDLSSSVEALDLQTPFFKGTFVDKVSQTVTSSGGTIYLNIQKDVVSGDTDFRVMWGTEDIITYSATSVALVSGTTEVPVLNWVSMSRTGIQTNTGWFTGNQLDVDGEFAPVGTVLCQSPADVALDGVYKHHAWVDRLEANSDGRGDNSKTAERERQIEANWDNGVLPTIVVGTEGARIDRIDYSNTVGVVYQKNRNVMPIRTTVGDLINIHIVNSTTSPYYEVTDLGLIDESYDGVAIANNNRVNIVVWGVVSQNQSDSKIFANAWLGTYASDLACENDSQNYADYNIPKEYQGTGFLIARIALKYTSANNGTWEILNSGNYYDLRGKIPNTSAGGAGGGTGTISVKNSIEQDVDLSYQLVGDELTPTNGEYYGYSGGSRGWFTIPEDTSKLDITDFFILI